MAAIYDKALKRKDFSGVVNKEEKEKENKDKPTTDDNGKRKRVYPPVFVCVGQVLMVDLGKTKAEKKQEKEKAAKADDPKAGADVGKIVNLMAGDANRVSDSRLLFVLTSAHGIELLDITNRIRILFPLWR